MSLSPRVVLVHYHLRGGGVTRVAEHIASAVEKMGGELLVLVGESPGPEVSLADRTVAVPALAYGTSLKDYDPARVMKDMQAIAREQLGGEPDIWHIHNHSLGKNAVLPEVVNQLAADNQKLLLQIHDFAEDGRPENYTYLLREVAGGDTTALGKRIYPTAGNVHYATLNLRDCDFLRQAGIPQGQLHHLPNAVDLGKPDSSVTTRMVKGKRKFIYPTRAIRRKNLGEFLLWSALAEEDEEFQVTLAPKNPTARPIYDRWVAFARQHNLPVTFEVGATSPLSFPELLRTAHGLLTTSVGEGFGLAFLEAWLARRPLYGRALPEITSEFVEAGVDLSCLYDRLDIPMSWLNREEVLTAIRTGLKRSWNAYGKELTSADEDAAIDAAIVGDFIDFGHLDEELQEMAICHLMDEGDAFRKIAPTVLEGVTPTAAEVDANRDVVRERFSLEVYGRRLEEVYTSLLESDNVPGEKFDAAALLDLFIAPERFCLLRT